jgi:membrane fusion protein, multidrug efflux system
MRTFIAIALVIIILILGKVFFFAKPENKEGGGGGGPQSGARGGGSGGGGNGAGNASGGGGGMGGGGGQPISVAVIVTKFEDIDNKITSSGTILPNEEVELRAEASGRLIELNIREGSVIAKGQIIAKIKDTDLKAQLQKLEFEETLAKQIEARQKKLLEINSISKEEYEIAANKINTLNADKDLIKAQLEKTVLKAPFGGRIGFKNVSEGAYVTPATNLATLVQMNPVKIDFTIPERYSSQLRIGSEIKFEVDGQASGFHARIAAIDPKIDPELRTMKIRAIAQNSKGNLMPGMFVRVTADLARERSIMIPTETIIPILQGKKVFVKKDGKATEVMITTGIRTEKTVQILSGLSVGDSLITSGIMALKKDAPVKAKK